MTVPKDSVQISMQVRCLSMCSSWWFKCHPVRAQTWQAHTCAHTNTLLTHHACTIDATREPRGRGATHVHTDHNHNTYLNTNTMRTHTTHSALATKTHCAPQMPRGNLEVVAPRMLVLAAIAATLQERDYASAWELATTNRVSEGTTQV